jgi:hypothetical protein
MLSVQHQPYQKATDGRKQKYFVAQLSLRAVQSLASSLERSYSKPNRSEGGTMVWLNYIMLGDKVQ